MKEKDTMIFGVWPVIEALNNGKEFDKIMVQKGLNIENQKELREAINKRNVLVQYVPKEKLNKITRKAHQGVIAFISLIEYQKIEDLIPFWFEKGKIPLIVMLDRITDVRNFGAIVRSLECAGVDAVIIPEKGSASINGDTVKTSAGAIFNLPVCKEHNLKNAIKFIKNSGFNVMACTEKGTKNYFEATYTEPTLLIMGSEEDGISDEYLKLADEVVKIPMYGETASLNVSVATALVVFEAVKQRNLAN